MFTGPDGASVFKVLAFARAKRAAHCAEVVGAGRWEPVMQGTGTSDFFRACRSEWQDAGYTIVVDHDEVRRDRGKKKAGTAATRP
eukprot:4563047-Prymnesium_polylepis.1